MEDIYHTLGISETVNIDCMVWTDTAKRLLVDVTNPEDIVTNP